MLESVVQPTIDNGKDRNDTIELLVNSTVLIQSTIFIVKSNGRQSLTGISVKKNLIVFDLV